MFGDYEAQRHWMEITLNTPVKEWLVTSETLYKDAYICDENIVMVHSLCSIHPAFEITYMLH